jgi:hypothetical protein
MAKQEASVEELVGMIQRGELRLPEMQRRYVWKSTRVRDLFDSLYRGYPSGTILLWESDEGVPLQAFSIAQNDNPFRTNRLLLDGQQRLTSLSAVIRGEPVEVRGRRRPIDLLFNLNHPDELAVVTEVDESSDGDGEVLADETEASEDELQLRFDKMAFVVGTRKLERLPHWVKVSEVFKVDADAPFLQRAGVEAISDPRYQKYSERLARLRSIRRYIYRMDILERSLSYEEVTEVFVRVNSLGAKLRSSDLALAQITAKWRRSLAVFQQFQNDCTDNGFELDLGLYIKALIAFATGQSRFRTVGSLSAEALQTAWTEACRGMEFAINFVRQNAGIESPAILASPFLLITVAVYGKQQQYELTPDQAGRLRFWILVANAKGRYSRGSSESFLDQDLVSVLRGNGVEELIDRLRLQVGRLDISPAELEGKNQRSAFFKTMYLAFKSAGATDWRSNLAIGLDHSGKQHKLQFHHIFPKAILKGHVTDRESDDISNLAFIGGGTNRRINVKPPSEYIPSIISKGGSNPFVLQGIPVDEKLLTIDAYKEFLSERRRTIAHMLNVFLGTDDAGVRDGASRGSEGGAVLSAGALVVKGEGVACEFKSTLRMNLHTRQSDIRIEREVLKSLAAFLNTDGGTLVIGVSDDGEPLGLAEDNFPSEDKMNLHLVNLIRDRIGPQHMLYIHPRFEDCKDERVLLVQCQRSRAPVYVKDGNMEHFFIRTGAATSELTGNRMQEFIKQRFR